MCRTAGGVMLRRAALHQGMRRQGRVDRIVDHCMMRMTAIGVGRRWWRGGATHLVFGGTLHRCYGDGEK